MTHPVTRPAGLLSAGLLSAGPLAALFAALFAALLASGAPPARADLVGPRDVERALEAISLAGIEEGAGSAAVAAASARQLRAAEWLGSHGTDARVMPALLVALTSRDARVAYAAARSIVRRARPEDASALLAIEPTLPPAPRGLVQLALARLGTEESDAWLLAVLGTPSPLERRSTREALEAIARDRRDALLPALLDGLRDAPSGPLLRWLASLGDERARPALERALQREAEQRRLGEEALEGLARLPANEGTARLLERLSAEGWFTPTPAFARACVAASPEIDVTRWFDPSVPAVREAALDAWMERAPERLVALLGEDPSALDAEGPGWLARALSHANPAFSSWFERILRDEGRPEGEREAALEALVQLAPCELSLEGVSLPDVALAEARLLRVCPTRRVAGAPLDASPASLHLRAIAGEDVSRLLAEAWPTADRAARLVLAHAWLASRGGDARDERGWLRRMEAEADPEVYAVLAFAAYARRASAFGSPPPRRLDDPATRLPSLALLGLSDEPLPPALSRRASQALGGASPEAAALALLALDRRAQGPSTSAFACAHLEDASLPLSRAARAVLRRRIERGGRADCLARATRATLHGSVAPGDPRAVSSEAASAPSPLLVVRVVSNVGRPPLRVALSSDEGATFVVRPPPSGIVVVSLDGALDGGAPEGMDVRLLLEDDRLED